MELDLFSGDEEPSELLDEDLSPLEYARRHTLCKPYISEILALNDMHAPPDDTFYRDLWDPSQAQITNDLSGLIKERLSVTKDTALLLKAIHDLREAPSDPVTVDGRRRILSLKHELPVLRRDHELDVLTFGSTALPDIRNLAIPSEVVDKENDEGLEWPAKYFTYPAQCSDRIKAEKLAVSRDVLLYLHNEIQDAYTTEDAEQVIVENLQYKPNLARRPLTPPLLPLSPPPTPYIPSSPANRLPFPESSDSAMAEAKALEQLIMAEDSLTRRNSDSSDSMLLDITHPPNFCPLSEERTTTILKRKADTLRVEGPLTPPMFSTSPMKKLKSVSFAEMLRVYSPKAPWAKTLSDNGPEGEDISVSDLDELFRDIEPFAEQARKQIRNERLSAADTTARVKVPNIEFTLPMAPWHEYSQRRGGKHRPGATETDAQMKFLLRVKREDLKSATTWHGISSLERHLHWNILMTKVTKINLDESIHGETDLKKILSETATGNIATSSAQVWKPEGLRILDAEEDEELIDPTETEEGHDIEALVRKRKLEMEEEAAEIQHKRTMVQQSSQARVQPLRDKQESHHWEDGIPVSRVAAPARSKTYDDRERRPQASVTQHIPQQQPKEALTELMFGGFSATTALHKFMESQGKSTKTVKDSVSDKDQMASHDRSSGARHLPVRSKTSPSIQITVARQDPHQTTATEQKGEAPPQLPQLPAIPANLAPCSFIVSSKLLQQRSMMKHIEKLYPYAELVYRDYGLAYSSVEEGDILLSPATGLIHTTLQQLKQRPLPGQPDRSPVKERMNALHLRYERLVVIISEGLSREMENHGTGRPEDPRNKEVLTQLEDFAGQLPGEILIRYVRGGEQALAHSIVIDMSNYGLPHGSRDAGDIKPSACETYWELFLRRAGLNPFAAQAIVALLGQPYDYQIPASSPASLELPRTVTVSGLTAFLTMSEDDRIRYFQALMGGSRVLKRVSRVLDQEWVSAAHGFRM